MRQLNIFNGGRFLKLLRQHILHSYIALLLGLLVGFGICFLVIAFFQIVGRDNQIHNDQFLIIAIFGYVILGAFYISTAFAAFRNKERAQSYLMTPGTTLEKFLVEIIFYPLLFSLLFPLLYWGAYELSTSLVSEIKPNFIPYNIVHEFKELLVTNESYVTDDGNLVTEETSVLRIWISTIFSLAMAFFLGAVSFKKYSLLKTLLGVVVYFGFCFGMLFLLMSYYGWGEYRLSHTTSYLTPFGMGIHDGNTAISFISGWLFCWGTIFGIVSFLKLKEKEV